ncbi:MAG: hypothetical protein IKN38_03330 [Clostridia bacterium]|nr:hypothetical protein [Clostridia bacterium]
MENKEMNGAERYERLEIEVVSFDAKDVIVTSTYTNPNPDEYEIII